ncbi:helix-turn-helix domain-containing protein, partial [Prevotella melaninogenica]
MTKEDVNSTYSLGNLTVCDLAREFGVSTRTIHRYLSSEYKENLPKFCLLYTSPSPRDVRVSRMPS